jgi:hypothetical protein
MFDLHFATGVRINRMATAEERGKREGAASVSQLPRSDGMESKTHVVTHGHRMMKRFYSCIGNQKKKSSRFHSEFLWSENLDPEYLSKVTESSRQCHWQYCILIG